MPQIQVIDSTPNKAEPSGVEEFFSKLSKHYSEKQAQDILAPIYESFGKNESNFQQTSAAIQKSNISPSKRIEAQKQLNDIEKINIENRKALEKGTASAGKEFGKIREKAVADYVNESVEAGQQASDQKFALGEARKAIKGDVTGPGFKALLKNNPYSQLVVGLSPDEATLQAANKQLVAGTKGLFGPKPTEREIFLLLNEMLPSIGKTQDANEAGLDFMEKVNDMKELRSNIVNELTNGGSKYVDNLEQQVSEKLKPVADALLDELKVANKRFNGSAEEKKKSGTIKVKAPDGSLWNMTQEQIDAAKKKGTIFEPV